ncbi:MAG: hypothetical protein K0S47_37 [Herbinix sp.]|jgi:hypothetical protein|nr:hypothetical protein [Herbinix sp.]
MNKSNRTLLSIVLVVLIILSTLLLHNHIKSVQAEEILSQDNSQTESGTTVYEKEKSKSAGIINKNGKLTLDTKYIHPNKFNIYYGELKYSGITDYSGYDFLIVNDMNGDSVAKVRSQGCKVFQYLYFGSRFENTDRFIKDMKEQILNLKQNGLADGVFLDECDVEYWEIGYSSNEKNCQIFYDKLKEVTDYCKSIGIQTVVNGARAFCDLGDYYLWESFQGYWTTNTLKWSNKITPREVTGLGEVNYGLSLSDWTLNGSCYYDGESIRGGAKGSAEILIDMDKILPKKDRKDIYDWVYFEWFGAGANDDNCTIWVWTGDELPFNEESWDNTWKKLPKLWKGEAQSWNGIGKSSRYLKIKMEFNGADDLNINSIVLTYDYKYPYYDMSASNGEADTNPYLWNFNHSQRDYLWEKTEATGNRVKILTHSYGSFDDEERKRYSFLSSEIWGFYSSDYVHPLMQDIYENNSVDEPIGMLLSRSEDNTGVFTGAIASVDLKKHTYILQRKEPAYWYERAAKIDGNTKEWSSEDLLYQHTGESFGAFPQGWGANSLTYHEGSFDNIKIESRDGNSVLELASDGTGIWISPIIKAYQLDAKGFMEDIYWNYRNGTVKYQIKYKQLNEKWTKWISYEKGKSNPNIDFIEFQVKVTLNGKSSYIEYKKQKDKNGKLKTLEVFHQGVSFWGSSHNWDLYLPDNLNIKNFMMMDDNEYIYFSYEVEGKIDFNQNLNLPSDYNYSIYLDTLNEPQKGYKGNWWNTTFGTNYRISNNGIFVWDDTYKDKSNNNGWKWIGSSGMIYKLSSDQSTIEYRVRKDSIGGLPSKNIKVFMYVDDSKTSIGNMVKPIESAKKYYEGYFTYSQQSFQMKTPHGWYCSEEMNLKVKDGYINLAWEEKKPEGTEIRAWIRTRQNDSNWGDWKEVTNGKPIYGTFDKVQSCFGLYTTQGDVSPEVSNIVLKAQE